LRLIAELRRRNVIRMAGLYLVGAWLLIQIAETLLPIFHTPDWVLQTLVVLLALGLVPALVFSWLYELTPEGLKRDAEVAPGQSIAAATARRMDRLIFIGLLALIAVIAADRWWPREAGPPAQLAVAAQLGLTVTGAAATSSADPEGPAVAPGSIAVLPFADLSPEGDQAWFADGISEEVLNVLVGVEGLTVASRTSSFQFRQHEAIGIPAIAEALKVRHVLEGSVRKAGERIRVTAQLIDSASDAHLWSDTFDRTLSTENLFDIQDEIAKAIVAAIGKNLAVQIGAVAPVPQRTGNLDAYALYLQARPSYYARENFGAMDVLLQRAIEIDPGFADALALRASVTMLSGDYGEPLGGSEAAAADLARGLAEQALARVPRHGLALGVLANLKSRPLADVRSSTATIAEVMAGFDAAVEADPNNVDLLNWRGRWLGFVARFADAERDFRHCREVEPAYAPCRVNLALALIMLDRPKEAADEIIDAAAHGAMIASELVLLPLHALDKREAFYLYASAQPALRGWYDMAAIYDALGKPDADHSGLRERLAAASAGSPDRSLLLIALGDDTQTTPNWLSWLPTFRAHRQLPVFRAHVVASGRLRYWQEHGFPAQCRAVGKDDFACD
jgi:TolB-like protein